MRMLVAMGIFTEVGHHTYSANLIANVWTVGSPLREASIHMASQIPPVVFLPEYFEEKGYRNPTDAENGPFQYTQRPKIQSAYNTMMRIARNQRGEEWFEYYPVEEKLRLAEHDESGILLVDIGGNVGHDLVNFQKRFPGLRGRLVLEDTPAIVDSATDLPPNIERVGHDFFTPQPHILQNAKAYYLRNVLHDWPDKNARTILENIRDLMGAESILLVDEYAVPEENVALYQAELDFIMMGGYLLRWIGRVVGVHRPRDYVPGSGTLFEAVGREE
ncbi:S-adenosyl-L-methionine-dependent methyltransferase [Bimuria novae-zelandiae CBS 107.79]|uniref:S-adenosyl-L-methionine-dependent methyltransferase n=1 Tax=Bimuria novae-zelandiae CBS 107.79 TaxID=1447943 RepID=A0A6A5UUN2_9PLEO|nr:S-adenosyl-L-methionine-dependent methyltransferase [Bimuria novae-zelandiae CBS 107.79]